MSGFVKVAVVGFLSAAIVGCAGPVVEYLVPLGIGELGVITRSRSIDEILADPQLDAVKREQLLWVADVLEFAKHQVGLKAGTSYQRYYDTGDGPAMYSVSASRKDALEPRTWRLPIVGKMEYLGYFHLDLARDKIEQLKAEGLDTFLGESIAYSTVGWLADPLYSSMLEYDQDVLTETIFHELTHNTIYKQGDPKFNESIATFVGRKGALAFIGQRLGPDSELYQDLPERIADRDLIDRFFEQLLDDLQAFYARSDLDSASKLSQREAVFEAARIRFVDEVTVALNHPERYDHLADLPTNNAWILMRYRYHKDLDVFEQVYAANDDDLAAAVRVFRQAAGADDPYQYLRQWVADRQ